MPGAPSSGQAAFPGEGRKPRKHGGALLPGQWMPRAKPMATMTSITTI